MRLTQIGLCASPGAALWSSLVALHPRLELPVTLERLLTRDQKDRIIPTKNIWGPFDDGDFDPAVVDRVRMRIMYPGKKRPSQMPPQMMKNMPRDPRQMRMPPNRDPRQMQMPQKPPMPK
jgi:hypothetical protein